MNRVNFVYGSFPDDTHFNGIEEAAESADLRLAREVVGRGIVSGFGLSMSAAGAVVAPGAGYDESGRQVHKADALASLFAALVRPAAGNGKWVAVYVAFTRNKYGEIYDDNNVKHDLYLDEDAEVKIEVGAEAALASAVRPAVASGVMVGDVLLDHDTAFVGLTVSTSRATKIPTVLALKGRELVVSRTVKGSDADSVLLSDLGLDPAGSYSASVQLRGSNAVLVTSTAVAISGGAITVRLAHIRPSHSLPQAGTPPVLVGEFTIGGFVVGDDAAIQYDLRVRREDI